MRFFEILEENYGLAQSEFARSADAEEVRAAIDQYRSLVSRNQFAGQERDINYWRTQGWAAFRDRVKSVALRPSATQLKRRRVEGRSITLREDAVWLIVVPLDKNASCFHGRDTEWCTVTVGDENRFNQYFHDSRITLIYCIKKASGYRWAIAYESGSDQPLDIYDRLDRTISGGEFQSQTGLGVQELIKLAERAGSDTDQVRQQRSNDRIDLGRVFDRRENYTPRSREIEAKLLDLERRDYTRDYLEANGKDQYPDDLIVLAISPSEGFDYAGHPRDTARWFIYQSQPSKSLIRRAVRKNPYVAQYVQGLDTELELELIEQDPDHFRLLSAPSEQAQLAYVNVYGTNIRHVNDPSEKVQMAAVEQSIQALKYIDFSERVYPQVIDSAIDQDPGAILQLMANKSFDLKQHLSQDQWQRGMDFVSDYLYVDPEIPKMRLAMLRAMPPEYIWPVMQHHWRYKLRPDDEDDGLARRSELAALDQELEYFLEVGGKRAPDPVLAQVKKYLESRQD
jgi:hypothetical protein